MVKLENDEFCDGENPEIETLAMVKIYETLRPTGTSGECDRASLVRCFVLLQVLHDTVTGRDGGSRCSGWTMLFCVCAVVDVRVVARLCLPLFYSSISRDAPSQTSSWCPFDSVYRRSRLSLC